MADDACLLLSGMAGYMAGDPRVHDPRILTTDFWSSSLLTVSAEHKVQLHQCSCIAERTYKYTISIIAHVRGTCEQEVRRMILELQRSSRASSINVEHFENKVS